MIANDSKVVNIGQTGSMQPKTPMVQQTIVHLSLVIINGIMERHSRPTIVDQTTHHEHRGSIELLNTADDDRLLNTDNRIRSQY